MNKNELNKWDQRWLDLSQQVSQWSKDPSTQVGAIIADGKNFVALGYNGFAPGVADDAERYANRELKYRMIIHGEVNAMHSAERSIRGCTLYTWPFMPCPVCAAQVIKRGIARVVAPYSDNPRWAADFEISKMQFREAGVELILINL
jgi:dCMP deaminase